MKKLLKTIGTEIADFIRMLLLKDYSKTEICNKVIQESIEKGNGEVNKFTIHAECKIRYFQIIVFWLFFTSCHSIPSHFSSF